jgi:hypothetical protein
MENAARKRGRPPRPDADYRRIASDLTKRMESGEWPTGTVLPSSRALAAHYGVGVGTIRWALGALKGEQRVRANARKRLVIQDPRHASGPSRFLILQVFNGYLNNWLPGAGFKATQLGILHQVGVLKASLLISGDPHYRFAVPPDLYDLPLRGVLLMGQYTRETLAQYEKVNLPVVLVDRAPGRSKLHAACIDNVAGAIDATSRLIQMGHRRIAFLRRVVTGVRDVDPDSLERQDGYCRGLKKAGLPVDKGLIINSLGGDEPDGPAMRAIVKTRPRVTAVLAADAGLASLVERAARHAERSVPEDLSIACFQETTATRPHFSGHQVDFEELGAKAVNLVLEPKERPRRVRVSTVWAEGDSTGPRRRKRR